MTKTSIPEPIQALVKTVNTWIEADNPFEGLVEVAPTGSRVICTPAVTDTEEDWIVFVPDSFSARAVDFLHTLGATNNEEQIHYPDGIVLWLGNLNIIIVTDYAMYMRWVAATYWARRFNIATKEERKLFFGDLVDMRRHSELIL